MSREDIVLVEPYVPSSEPPVKSGKTLKARIVRRIGRPFLTEMTPQEFAAQHDFRMLSEDDVAINPDRAMRFDVESFTAIGDKPYLTRHTWPGPSPDRDGWKLLLADPKSVFAVVYGKNPESGPDRQNPSDRPVRRRETGAPRRRAPTSAR